MSDQTDAPPDPVTPTEPLTKSTFVATADGTDDPPPLRKGGFGRLLAWIAPASLVVSMLWGAVPGILLPIQLQIMDAAHKEANLAVVLSISSVGALIAAPIAGQVSDRTRSRFGRRAPWLVLGTLVGALALVGVAFAGSIVGIAIAWTLVQIGFNFVQGPLSAILPDRVPRKRRGTYAAVTGIALMAGSVLGSVIAAVFADSYVIGYLFFAVAALVVLLLFVAFNPDYSSKNLTLDKFTWMDFVRTFWVNPIKHPDFFWAFTGRLLLFIGYYMVIGYQLYLLSDYIGLKHPETVIPIVGVVGLAGIIVSNLAAGPLSDRFRRRKPFVFGAAVVMALALAIPWAWPTLGGWIAMYAVLSLGFGMYAAVDTALMSEVLPSAKSFGKDLGVINIAATLPQAIGPAVAGAVILVFGYAGLFPVGIVLSLLGAAAIWPIKSVR